MDDVKVLFLLAQYQASSGQNHMKFYSFRKGASQITEPTAVAPQQPRPCYKAYMFFLIHTTKGCTGVKKNGKLTGKQKTG
jgi:hypothetical protein